MGLNVDEVQVYQTCWRCWGWVVCDGGVHEHSCSWVWLSDTCVRDNRPLQSSSYHNRYACLYHSLLLYTITSSASILQTVIVPVIKFNAVPIHGDTARTYLQRDVRCKEVQCERLLGQLNMMSATSGEQDYVIIRVIIDSRCSSHTSKCLNYIDNCKVMVEEDKSTMTLTDKTRVQIRGRGTCGILGQV